MMPTSRTIVVELGMNGQILAVEKALIDETREQVVCQIHKYQKEIQKYYDKNIKRNDFKVGD